MIPRLRELRELGITAIELMPVATFPGERGWGYDGLYAWAPHPAYGGPEGLLRLIEAAHREGLGVVLDVVYNHVGPGNEALGAFGPYFTDRYETFWGDAIDYSQAAVREWAIQNAEMWVRDYGIDGLRLDATHAVFDDSPKHVLAELAERVAAGAGHLRDGDRRPPPDRGVGSRRPVGGRAAPRAARPAHGRARRLLRGLRLPRRPRRPARAQAARAARRLLAEPRPGRQPGARRPAPAEELRLRAAVTLFAPQTPLLFQGEEYGEQRPFLFFTDHVDPAIADATREGRRREFAAFAAFAGEAVPDPQARETFERSKLDPSAGDDELRAFYRELLALRRDLPREASTSVDGSVLRVRRGDLELVADFDALTAELRR